MWQTVGVPRRDNSWYPVYKRSWYPADIRLISSIASCWIRSKHVCFQRFIYFFTLTAIYWYLANISVYPADIFWYSAETCPIFNWNSVHFVWISVYYTSDIRLVSLISWYPVYRFPARCYPLGSTLSQVLCKLTLSRASYIANWRKLELGIFTTG